MWQPICVLILSATIIVFLYSFQIGSLVKGTSVPEVNSRSQSTSLQVVVENPINGPYKLMKLAAQRIHRNIAAERLISGFGAGLAILLFYLLARRFTNRFAAGFTTAMFASSSVLLNTGRMATPLITLMALLFLFVSGYYIRFNKHKSRSWIITAIIVSLALYIPGLFYFIALGSLWQYKSMNRQHALPKLKQSVITVGTVILLLLPLLYGLVRDPSLLREYLLIPSSLPDIKDFLFGLFSVPLGIIAFAPKNPIFRLGHQPTLDVFAVAMFVVGIYTLVKRYKLDRFILFSGIFVLSCLLTALSGNYEYSFILLPFVYLVVAMGMNVLLDSWRKTFPYNPLARSLALVVIGVAVIASCNFQFRRYFVAWPHNDLTQSVFSDR